MNQKPLLNVTQTLVLLTELGAPMCKRTFHYAVKAQRLPQPIRLTPARPLWRAADIHSFIKSL